MTFMLDDLGRILTNYAHEQHGFALFGFANDEVMRVHLAAPNAGYVLVIERDGQMIVLNPASLTVTDDGIRYLPSISTGESSIGMHPQRYTATQQTTFAEVARAIDAPGTGVAIARYNNATADTPVAQAETVLIPPTIGMVVHDFDGVAHLQHTSLLHGSQLPQYPVLGFRPYRPHHSLWHTLVQDWVLMAEATLVVIASAMSAGAMVPVLGSALLGDMLAGMAAGAVAGLVGNALGQEILIADGDQAHFDTHAVERAGVHGAITGAFAAVGAKYPHMSLTNRMLLNTGQYALQTEVGRALNEPVHITVRNLLITALQTVANSKLSKAYGKIHDYGDAVGFGVESGLSNAFIEGALRKHPFRHWGDTLLYDTMQGIVNEMTGHYLQVRQQDAVQTKAYQQRLMKATLAYIHQHGLYMDDDEKLPIHKRSPMGANRHVPQHTPPSGPAPAQHESNLLNDMEHWYHQGMQDVNAGLHQLQRFALKENALQHQAKMLAFLKHSKVRYAKYAHYAQHHHDPWILTFDKRYAPRLMGVLTTVGGLAETIGGVGLAVLSDGFGSYAALPMAAHGTDVMWSGMEAIWSGHYHTDVTQRMIYRTTGSAKAAVYGDMALSLGSNIAAGAVGIVKAIRAGKLTSMFGLFSRGTQEVEDEIAVLKSPAKRHYIQNITQKTVAKNANTVVLSHVDVAGDVKLIRAGKAVREGEHFKVNGRVYGHHNGRLYPISGDGLYLLDRPSFKALGVYNKFGDTSTSSRILDNMHLSMEAREKALAVWKKGFANGGPKP